MPVTAKPKTDPPKINKRQRELLTELYVKLDSRTATRDEMASHIEKFSGAYTGKAGDPKALKQAFAKLERLADAGLLRRVTKDGSKLAVPAKVGRQL